jgi:hypothetical protein
MASLARPSALPLIAAHSSERFAHGERGLEEQGRRGILFRSQHASAATKDIEWGGRAIRQLERV